MIKKTTISMSLSDVMFFRAHEPKTPIRRILYRSLDLFLNWMILSIISFCCIDIGPILVVVGIHHALFSKNRNQLRFTRLFCQY